MVEDKTKKEKYGYNYIQFTVDDEFKENIEKFTIEAGFKTTSEFVRSAVREKLDRMLYPERFYTSSSNVIDPKYLEQITINTKKIVELEELNQKSINFFAEMKKILEKISKYAIKGLVDEKETISNLFKAHKSLTPEMIIKKTHYDEEIIFSILTELQEENYIKLNTNGRFEIIE